MTIYALSTGPGVSGVAIIRISGQQSSKVIETLTGMKVPNSDRLKEPPVWPCLQQDRDLWNKSVPVQKSVKSLNPSHHW